MRHTLYDTQYVVKGNFEATARSVLQQRMSSGGGLQADEGLAVLCDSTVLEKSLQWKLETRNLKLLLKHPTGIAPAGI
jgi:hypothetical protein